MERRLARYVLCFPVVLLAGAGMVGWLIRMGASLLYHESIDGRVSI